MLPIATVNRRDRLMFTGPLRVRTRSRGVKARGVKAPSRVGHPDTSHRGVVRALLRSESGCFVCFDVAETVFLH